MSDERSGSVAQVAGRFAFGAVAIAMRQDGTSRALDFALPLVRAPEIARAIEYLEESPDEPDDPTRTKLVERRGDVRAELFRRVVAGGEPLLRAAVEVACGAVDVADRKVAQLLLAHHERLPRWACTRLEGSERFETWALAQLHRRPWDDYLLEPTGSDPGEGDAVIWPPPEKALERELAERTAYSRERLAQCSEEYQEGYAEHAVPRLRRLAELIDHSPGATPDLDGDGDPEAVVTRNFWE